MSDRLPHASSSDIERMQEAGGLLWWKEAVYPEMRPITVEDVVDLMHRLWRDNQQGPPQFIYASVETVDTFLGLISRYRRRANRRHRKRQKRAIGRHRW